MYLILVIKFKQQSLIFSPPSREKLIMFAHLLSAAFSMALCSVPWVILMCLFLSSFSVIQNPWVAPSSFCERSWRCPTCFFWLYLCLVVSAWKSEPTSWCWAYLSCPHLCCFRHVCVCLVLQGFHYVVFFFFLLLFFLSPYREAMVGRSRLRIMMNIVKGEQAWCDRCKKLPWVFY